MKNVPEHVKSNPALMEAYRMGYEEAVTVPEKVSARMQRVDSNGAFWFQVVDYRNVPRVSLDHASFKDACKLVKKLGGKPWDTETGSSEKE